MNIFILHEDLHESAKLLADQHLGKQILEIAQILSTVSDGPYRPTHKNHPVTIWAEKHKETVHQYAHVLDNEYQYRFNKRHKSSLVIEELRMKGNMFYTMVDTDDLKSFPIRNNIDYYMEKLTAWLNRDKPLRARWTSRPVPKWYEDLTGNTQANTPNFVFM